MARRRKTKAQRELERLLAPIKSTAKSLESAAPREDPKRDTTKYAAVTVSDSPRGRRRPQGKLVVSEVPYTKRSRRIAERQQRETADYMADPLTRSAATILNIPLGIVLSGRGGVLDINRARKGDFSFPETRKMAKDVVVGSIESVKHPGRDPAAALLTVFGAASLGATGVAKLSVVSKLASSGRYAEAAKAMGRRPPPGDRIFKSPRGFETRGTYSRNALSEAWQRTHDFYLHRGKEGSLRERKLNRRIGQEQRKRRLAEEAIEAAPAAGVARYHLTTPQQIALRLVAENVTPAERTATLRSALASSKTTADKLAIRTKIRLTKAAEKYLVADVGGGVSLSARSKKLQAAYDDAAAVADSRTALLLEIDRLTPDAAENRVNAPGRVYRGAEYEEGAGLVGGEAGPPGRFRVPYKQGITRPPSGRVGGAGRIGYEPPAPGTLTHSYTGALQRSGRFREAATKLIAEDAIEAQNYRRILAIRERFRDAARPVRQDGDIPIRLKGGRLSQRARELLGKADEEGIVLSRTERRELGRQYEDFRRDMFPENYTPEEVTAGDVGFIPEKWLGHANEPKDYAALLKGSPRALVDSWDSLNNAAKLVLVYAKIGYIPPNLIGNVVLNFMQQGFLALPNLYRATNASRKMTPTEGAWFDSLMGAGVVRALVSDTRGALGKTTSKVADAVSLPTDRYTRRASLWYQLDRRGYGNLAKIRELRRKYDEGDPVAKEHLIEAVRRARENAIEYENLTPLERTVWQRIIFIYPWVKGSTTYTGRFVRDHPVQSATYYQLGEIGKEHSERVLGPLPSYMAGLIPVGGTEENPQAIDPRGVSSVNTMADVIGALDAIRSGRVPERSFPSEFIQPLLQLGIGKAFGINPQTRNPLPAGMSNQEYLWETFGRSLPQVSAYEAIKGKEPYESAIMQRSANEQRTRIGLGSLAPLTISKKTANDRAIEERLGLEPKDKRAEFYARRDRNKMEKALADAGATEAFRGDKLEPKLEKAWKLREQRKKATANIRRPPHGASERASAEYQREAYAAEFDLAIRLKLRTAAHKRLALRWAKTVASDDISDAREALADKYFGYGYINDVRAWARENYDADFD